MAAAAVATAAFAAACGEWRTAKASMRCTLLSPHVRGVCRLGALTMARTAGATVAGHVATAAMLADGHDRPPTPLLHACVAYVEVADTPGQFQQYAKRSCLDIGFPSPSKVG